MSIDVVSVTHDAAALYGFVDSILASVEDLPATVYAKASRDLLSYISDLASKTKLYLDLFPTQLPTSSELLKQVYCQKLSTLRKAWTDLHGYVKPSIDADTLNTPFSLLLAFYQKFQKIAGFSGISFSVFHLTEVNYLQVRASWIAQLAQKIAAIIPGAPQFPADLGLIGIPYSQSSAVFLNALIPHEMGHFVYQRLNKSSDLQAHIYSALQVAFGATSISSDDTRWCLDKVYRWAEEIFCDLFALWMAGPAYCFAFIELLDLGRISTPSGPGLSREDLVFRPRHPAHSCRLGQQVLFLRTLGWYAHIASYKSNYIELLKDVEKLSPASYRFSYDKPHLEAQTVSAFISVLPYIMSTVEGVVGGLDCGVGEFGNCQVKVQDYLHNGVVPSSIVKQSELQGELPDFEWPTPISVLNVAFRVRLESLNKLMDKVGEDPNKVSLRSKWEKKLESWSAKAFEDYSLITANTIS
jgi:hypothetical protein